MFLHFSPFFCLYTFTSIFPRKCYSFSPPPITNPPPSSTVPLNPAGKSFISMFKYMHSVSMNYLMEIPRICIISRCIYGSPSTYWCLGHFSLPEHLRKRGRLVRKYYFKFDGRKSLWFLLKRCKKIGCCFLTPVTSSSRAAEPSERLILAAVKCEQQRVTAVNETTKQRHLTAVNAHNATYQVNICGALRQICEPHTQVRRMLIE